MKSLYARLMVVIFAISSLGLFLATPVKQALAYSPTLSIYNTNNGNNQVTVSVYSASPYSTVTIYYVSSNGQSIVAGTFGQTDSNGSFSIQESWGNDYQSGITGRYATISGDMTNTVNSSTYSTGGGTGGITFSQTNPTLTVGQSMSVSIYSQYGNNSYYISSNSNSSVVSAYISGSTLQISGMTNGSSSIVVCASGTYYNNQCGTLYVTVSGSGYGNLTFSPSNPTLSVGQSMSVSIYSQNNSGSYYISSNSNSSVVSAYVSGSTLQISGMTTGSSSIVVCSSNTYYNNQCGTLYVTVSGGGSGTLTFSNSNPSLSVGQTYTVSVYSTNNSYSYYISQNSNSSVVSANVSGSVVNLYGLMNGYSTVTVCSNNSGYYGSSCGMINVTVNGGGSYGTITATPNNPYINVGQTLAISLSISSYNYYNNTFYISSNTNSNIVSANISGSTLNVYGINYGTDVITVCVSNYGGSNIPCLPITVTVNNGGGQNGPITFSQSNITVQTGKQSVITVSGGSGYMYGSQQYFISSNSNPSVINASVTGNQLTVYGNTVGNSTLIVCSSSNGYPYNNNSNCGTLYVTVTGSQVLGANTYPNGELIQEGQQISIVYKNTKTPFSNYGAFVGLGYSLSNVVNVGYSGLPLSGFTVTTANSSHPWGTWVKNGTTVYFVYQQTLIPVPSYDIFTNNGGQGSFIVQANGYDMGLPMASIMTYADTRLQ